MPDAVKPFASQMELIESQRAVNRAPYQYRETMADAHAARVAASDAEELGIAPSIGITPDRASYDTTPLPTEAESRRAEKHAANTARMTTDPFSNARTFQSADHASREELTFDRGIASASVPFPSSEPQKQ